MDTDKNPGMSIAPSIVRDGFGSRLSAYLIALEGYRRGLSLELLDGQFKRFTLSSDERSMMFFRSRVEKVTKEAITITIVKHRTKQYLKKNNVPVPEGEAFSEETADDEILRYAEKLGFPVVLKPYRGSEGAGVVANIMNEKEMNDAMHYVRREMGRPKVLVEKFIKGDDYRVYIVEGQVGGVIKRIPANVTGNGKDSIEILIEKKNSIRRANPHLSKGLIKMDYEVKSHIERAGYSPESVLEEGKVLQLRDKGSASAGGDTINFTKEFPEVFKQAAINAVKAIPGLYNGGVDMIVDVKTKQGVVIEINEMAQLGIHAYPAVGEGINIAAMMLDHYFPETLGESKYVLGRNNLVFNLKRSLIPLKEKAAESVKVAPAPRGKISARRIVLRENCNGKDLKKWVQKQALELDLIGTVVKAKNGEIKIILGGKGVKIRAFEEKLKNSDFQLTQYQSSVYKSLLRTGFEIR